MLQGLKKLRKYTNWFNMDVESLEKLKGDESKEYILSTLRTMKEELETLSSLVEDFENQVDE
jgi:hypothetical protein